MVRPGMHTRGLYLTLFLVDPATSIAFPTTLKIQSKTPLPTFTLIGVGVRTVSFLGIKVYSVGFYADLSSPSLATVCLLALLHRMLLNRAVVAERPNARRED